MAGEEVIRVRCPACGKKLGFPRSAVGRKAKCPGCQHTFRVAEPGQEFAAVPPQGTPAATRAQEAPPDGRIRVPCPACGKRLTFPASAVGRKAKCAGCEEVFVVEQVATAPQPAVAAAPAVQQESADCPPDEADSLYSLAEAERAAEAVDLPAPAMQAAPAPSFPPHDPATGYPADSSMAQAARAAAGGMLGRFFSAAGGLARGIIFCGVAGLVGALAYYGVAKATGYDFGYFAVLIGALCGVAMHLGFRAEGALAGVIAGGMTIGSAILAKIMVVAWLIMPMGATDSAEDLKDQRQVLIQYYAEESLRQQNLDPQTSTPAQDAKAEREARQKVNAMSKDEVQLAYKRMALMQHYTEQALEKQKTDSEDATPQQLARAQADARQKVNALSPAELQAEYEKAVAKENELSKGWWVLFIALLFGIRGLVALGIGVVTAFKIGSSGLSFGSSS